MRRYPKENKAGSSAGFVVVIIIAQLLIVGALAFTDAVDQPHSARIFLPGTQSNGITGHPMTRRMGELAFSRTGS